MKKNNLSEEISKIIFDVLQKINVNFDIKNIIVNLPKHYQFGDYTTNIAFQIS